jgi:hypothetical protein
MRPQTHPLIPAKAGTQAGIAVFAGENTEKTEIAAPSVISVASGVDLSNACLGPGLRRDERISGGVA